MNNDISDNNDTVKSLLDNDYESNGNYKIYHNHSIRSNSSNNDAMNNFGENILEDINKNSAIDILILAIISVMFLKTVLVVILVSTSYHTVSSALWQIFYESIILCDLSTGIEITTEDRWKPLVIAKKSMINVLIIEKKQNKTKQKKNGSNEREMKERYLLRKP